MSGCSKPVKSKKKPDDVPPAPPHTLNASEITETARSAKAPHELLFKVTYDSAQVTIGSQGLEQGQVNGIHGELYRLGKLVSTFSAQTGKVDKAKQTIQATGSVLIKSKDPGGILRCDRMEYESGLKVVKAIGNVETQSSSGTIGTLPEAWATPDLRKIGSPSLFGTKL